VLGRRHAATAFRPSAPVGPVRAASRGQTAALLVGLLAVALGIAVASFAVKPSKARSFDLFYGSIFMDDNTSPVAIDLASGKPTVRLHNAFTAVSAKSTGDLDVFPLAGGTLMLNPSSGEFNMVDDSGFVLKTIGGGVRLPLFVGPSSSRAVAAGDSAYIVQSGPRASAVYLVSQSTVASAIGPSAQAKARASASLTSPALDTPGAAAASNGDLWLLTGQGRSHHILQLSVPRGSNAGAALVEHQRGIVSGVAAVDSASHNADGTGPDAVAIASPRTIRVYADDGTSRQTTVSGQVGVDQILPVTNLQGSFAFLYHSGSGWSLVTAPVDGGGSASVHRIGALNGGTHLVVPAESGGRVFTMTSDGDGSLWQIDMTGSARTLAGASRYPLLGGERLDLLGAEVEARGNRVLFNARGNFEAIVAFTDGSHPPRTIDKHSALQVDANGSTTIATGRQSGPNKTKPTAPPKPQAQAQPAQPVNAKVSCKSTTQVPHIPTVQLIERGSRSVQLAWHYPLLDTQDCAPTTYTVAVKLMDSAAPAPPAAVTVQAQAGVNLIGLFPDTEYQLVVTAYINGRGTPSLPLTVRTGIEGPAAPNGVRTTVDSAGNWRISWNSCGGIQSGCVPVASWQVIPKLCDGLGLSNPPETRQFVGDPTQHSFSYLYAGGEALLGRALSFQIEGIGQKGTIGGPSGDKACSRSWTPPVASDISLAASAPPGITGQSTTQTTVSAHFRAGQTHDLGGVGGQLIYELLSGGRVVAKVGPTTAASTTLAGIQAGQRYQVDLIAIPPGHSSAAVHIGPVDVQPAFAAWPNPSVAASFSDTTAVTGALSVTVGFPAGTDTHGETFDLTNSTLSCGNSVRDLSYSNLSPGVAMTFPDIQRSQYNGSCAVTIALVQNSRTATSPPLYGAGASKRATSGPVIIDPPTLTATANDFSAGWGSTDPTNPTIVVSYDSADPLLLTFAQNWQMAVSNGGATSCGAVSGDAPPTTIAVTKSCVQAGGAFSVGVSFTYFGAPQHFTVQVSGTKPQPVDLATITMVAQWTGLSHRLTGEFVQIGYSDGATPYDPSKLNWTMTVTSNLSAGATCARTNQPPDASGTGPVLTIDKNACPYQTGGASTGPETSPAPTATPANYTVNIHVVDPSYGSTRDWTINLGTAPQ